jgi:uracil-DNA glycosylase
MFVAHNYDSINAHARAKARRGEVDSPFWRDRLIRYISMAGIDPADVFFTNVLMGCKPGSAIGDMPVVPGYEEQCVAFLRRQIEIVKPRVVIAFGAKARTRVRLVLPQAGSVMHPSAREFNPLVTRTDRLREQAELLAALVRRES